MSMYEKVNIKMVTGAIISDFGFWKTNSSKIIWSWLSFHPIKKVNPVFFKVRRGWSRLKRSCRWASRSRTSGFRLRATLRLSQLPDSARRRSCSSARTLPLRRTQVRPRLREIKWPRRRRRRQRQLRCRHWRRWQRGWRHRVKRICFQFLRRLQICAAVLRRRRDLSAAVLLSAVFGFRLIIGCNQSTAVSWARWRWAYRRRGLGRVPEYPGVISSLSYT